MSNTPTSPFMFDNSGKEYIHSCQLVQFFLLVGIVAVAFGMMVRVFKIGKFYGDDELIEENPQQIPSLHNE